MGKITNRLIIYIAAATIFAVGGYIVYLNYQLNRAQATTVELSYQIDSMEVANDTLRNISQDLAERWANENLMRHYFERRSQQVEIVKDSLAAALRRESRLRGELTARIDSLYTVIESPTTQEGEDRLATFIKYEEPFTVNMMVRLPPPPALGAAAVKVTVDPITMGISVLCEDRIDASVVRKATVVVDVPEWLTLGDLTVEQSREVCNVVLESPDVPFWKSWKAGVVGTLTVLGGVLVLVGGG